MAQSRCIGQRELISVLIIILGNLMTFQPPTGSILYLKRVKALGDHLLKRTGKASGQTQARGA
jgi:hypothetical protein